MMRRTISTVLLLAVLGGTAWAISTQAANRLKVGKGLLASGHYAAAIDEFKALVALEPSYPDGFYLLGLAYRGDGKAKEALLAFDRAVYLLPTFEEAFLQSADIEAEMGDFDSAKATLEELLTRVPTSARAHYGLGVVAYKTGHLPEAVNEWNLCVARDPKYAPAHANLGVALGLQGHADLAARQFLLAISLNPQRTLYRFNLGWMWRSAGNTKEAKDAFDQVVAREPGGPEAAAVAVIRAQDAGQWTEALGKAQDLMRLHPDFDQGHFLLALALEQANQLKSARDELEWCVRTDPNDAAYRAALDRVLEKLMKFPPTPAPPPAPAPTKAMP